MKRKLSLLIAAVLSALALSGAEKPKSMPTPEFTMPLMQQAPVIDGKISDAEWTGSVQMIGYCNLFKEELFPAKAVYRFGSDGKNLYFAATCAAGKNGILKNVPFKKGNSLSYVDDCFEFVFVSDPAKAGGHDIYHILINANGAKFSQSVKNGKPGVWDIEPKTASIAENGQWTFETQIPLASMGITDLSKPLGARLVRNWKRIVYSQCNGGQSTCENAPGDFLSANRISTFTFRNDSCFVETLQLADEGNKDKYNLKFRITNPTSSPIPVKVVVSGKPVNSQPSHLEKTLTIGANSSETVSAAGEVLGDELITSMIDITSPDGKTVYFRRNFQWRRNNDAAIFDETTNDSERINVKFTYLPSYNKMRIIANLSTLKEKNQLKGITAKIMDKKGNIIAEKTLAAPDAKSMSETEWSVPDLRPVTVKNNDSLYTLRVDFEGIPNGRKDYTFYRDAMEWEGNTIGKSEDIQIPPFTPITFSNMTLGTIGKQHTLMANGLWKQVNGAGKDILRDGGMVLEAVKNGKVYPVTAKDFKVVKHSKTRLETTSDIVCDILKGSIHAWWEDDGMMRWKMTLTEGSADLLRMVIPFRREIAMSLHPCTDGIRYNYGGCIPAGTGCVWDGKKAPRTSIVGSYVPYIFIGNAVQGLAVFGENDCGWTQNDKLPAQQIFRKGNGDVDLVMNLFAAPTEVKEPRTIDIGFLASPVKPMAKDWRVHEGIPGLLACYYWGGETAFCQVYPRNQDTSLWTEMVRVRNCGKRDPEFIRKWLDGYAPMYPRDSKEDKDRRTSLGNHINFTFNVMCDMYRNEKMRDRGILIYTNGRGLNYHDPDGRTYCDQWTCYETVDRKFTRTSQTWYFMDPDDVYQDFAAFWYKKMFESKAIEAIYWDDMFMQSNFTLGASAAYRLPDGSIQPASGIYNLRNLARRCASVQVELGMTPYNEIHMTNANLLPVLSYVQSTLDWEDTMGGMDFQDRYSKECVLGVDAGRQAGVSVAALGPISVDTPERMQELIRTGIGVSFTHEISWDGHGKASKEIKTFKKHLDDFGYRKDSAVNVWNYWEDNYPLTVTGGESSSIVMAKDGKVMLIVCDYGNTGGTSFTVKPDTKVLRLKDDFTAKNAETGAELKVKDGAVSFTLKKHDCIMLALE